MRENKHQFEFQMNYTFTPVSGTTGPTTACIRVCVRGRIEMEPMYFTAIAGRCIIKNIPHLKLFILHLKK